MRDQLKTLLLGVLILILVGFSAAFYQALNKTIPALRPQPLNIIEPVTTSETVTSSSTPILRSDQIEVNVGTSTLILDLATTSAARSQGLSGRASLGSNAGMLFVFEEPGLYGFWMKEMKFSLDLIWLDSKGKVVDITTNLRPQTYPKAFYPVSPVKYVIEVNAGWTKINNLEVGDTLEPLDF